jgi:hypothetical protein
LLKGSDRRRDRTAPWNAGRLYLTPETTHAVVALAITARARRTAPVWRQIDRLITRLAEGLAKGGRVLTITITTTGPTGASRRSVAIVRISEAAAAGGGLAHRVFAVEGARQRAGTPRVAACAVPAGAGGEAVWALLARTCEAVTRADWTEP